MTILNGLKLMENAKIQKCHFVQTKVVQKCQKWSILTSFCNTEACCQTVLPDRSILIGKKNGKKCHKNKTNATFQVILEHCCPIEIYLSSNTI